MPRPLIAADPPAQPIAPIAAGSSGTIEIDLQAALLGLEACISEEYGRVTLGMVQQLREALLAAT
jgi:hypothetical protein